MPVTLLNHLGLQEASGTIANDSIGSAVGTVSGTTFHGTGENTGPFAALPRCLVLRGVDSSDVVTVPKSDFPTGGDYTLSMYVRVDRTSLFNESYGTVMARGTNDAGWTLRLLNAVEFNVYMSGNKGTGGDVIIGEWRRLILSFRDSDNQVNCYVIEPDGTKETFATFSGNAYFFGLTEKPWTFGSDLDVGRRIYGGIAGIQMASGVIDPSEVDYSTSLGGAAWPSTGSSALADPVSDPLKTKPVSTRVVFDPVSN
jgi:hypothetical protein